MSGAEDIIRRANQIEQNEIEFDLDNFITDFEQGFPRFEKINPNFKAHYWGQGFQSRPRFKELNEEADAQQIEGYRLIEFFPNRENKEESYLLFGTPAQIQTQAVTLMNMSLMLRGISIGEWLGYPLEEAKLPPSSSIMARILLLTNPYGDQNRRGLGYKSQRQITVPEVNRAALTYARLRQACGGAQGLQWGNWQSRAWVAKGEEIKAMHQMVAGGDAKSAAMAHLNGFLQFTSCRLKNRTETELNFDAGARAKDPYRVQKRKFRVYAGYLIIFNSRLVAAPQPPTRGKPTTLGKQLRSKIKLPIYNESEPAGWSAALNEIFKQIT